MKVCKVLLSVSDHTGLIELGRSLIRAGAVLVATGETAKVLENGGLSVTRVEAVSQSPRIFQGRLRKLLFPFFTETMYTNYFAGGAETLKSNAGTPVDALVVNMKPAQSLDKTDQRQDPYYCEKIGRINIQSPTMVRAAIACKSDMLVVTHPDQYEEIINELKLYSQISEETRFRLATEASDHIEPYNADIRRTLGHY